MVDWSSFQAKDYQVSAKIAGVLHRDGAIRKIIQLFTITGTAIFWILGLFICYIFSLTDRSKIYTIGFVMIIMLIPVFIIKHIIKRPRPDFKDTRLGAIAFDKWSFPSGHATRATYIMILMGLLYPHSLWFWILWGCLILLSRLLLGVHYLSDILAGIIFSTLCMWILYLINWIPEAPFSSFFH